MSYTALYARTSTDTQNTGLESQIRAMQAYCFSNCITDFIVFSDNGVSGTKESRPALDDLLSAVDRGGIKTVIVYSFSRMARSTSHLLKVLAKFDSLSIAFVSLSEKLDTGNAIGRAMFTIIAALSQLERDQISERVKNGLKNARAKGKILGAKKRITNIELILKLANQGMRQRDIARLAECSAASVNREIKKAKLAMLQCVS